MSKAYINHDQRNTGCAGMEIPKEPGGNRADPKRPHASLTLDQLLALSELTVQRASELSELVKIVTAAMEASSMEDFNRIRRIYAAKAARCHELTVSIRAAETVLIGKVLED